MNLAEYVQKYSVRGACQCGRCIDAPPNPEEHQPPDSVHTVDMTFFKVARVEGGDAETFLQLVEEEFPHWLNGEEHSYLQTGGDIGDQGIAIQATGLGHILGVWKAFSPNMVLPMLDVDTRMRMAGAGYITLKKELHETTRIP